MTKWKNEIVVELLESGQLRSIDDLESYNRYLDYLVAETGREIEEIHLEIFDQHRASLPPGSGGRVVTRGQEPNLFIPLVIIATEQVNELRAAQMKDLRNAWHKRRPRGASPNGGGPTLSDWLRAQPTSADLRPI